MEHWERSKGCNFECTVLLPLLQGRKVEKVDEKVGLLPLYSLMTVEEFSAIYFAESIPICQRIFSLNLISQVLKRQYNLKKN